MKYRRKNKSGFTLIELIVVIAILAILAILAVPSFSGAKEKSAESVCKANRDLIIRKWKIENVTNSISLDDYYSKNKDVDPDLKKAICPDKGIIHVVDGGKKITCSIHGSLGGDWGFKINEIKKIYDAENNGYIGNFIVELNKKFVQNKLYEKFDVKDMLPEDFKDTINSQVGNLTQKQKDYLKDIDAGKMYYTPYYAGGKKEKDQSFNEDNVLYYTTENGETGLDFIKDNGYKETQLMYFDGSWYFNKKNDKPFYPQYIIRDEKDATDKQYLTKFFNNELDDKSSNRDTYEWVKLGSK